MNTPGDERDRVREGEREGGREGGRERGREGERERSIMGRVLENLGLANLKA